MEGESGGLEKRSIQAREWGGGWGAGSGWRGGESGRGEIWWRWWAFQTFEGIACVLSPVNLPGGGGLVHCDLVRRSISHAAR
jgi:hypothetical protein